MYRQATAATATHAMKMGIITITDIATARVESGDLLTQGIPLSTILQSVHSCSLN
jgi:hypothetical protein